MNLHTSYIVHFGVTPTIHRTVYTFSYYVVCSTSELGPDVWPRYVHQPALSKFYTCTYSTYYVQYIDSISTSYNYPCITVPARFQLHRWARHRIVRHLQRSRGHTARGVHEAMRGGNTWEGRTRLPLSRSVGNDPLSCCTAPFSNSPAGPSVVSLPLHTSMYSMYILYGVQSTYFTLVWYRYDQVLR